jgi:hypothetical protein
VLHSSLQLKALTFSGGFLVRLGVAQHVVKMCSILMRSRLCNIWHLRAYMFVLVLCGISSSGWYRYDCLYACTVGGIGGG